MSFPKLKKKSKSKTEPSDTDQIGYQIKSASDLPKFHKAIWQEDFNKVSQLIKKTDVNGRDKEQRTPLHLAAAKANEPIMKLLCHYNPNMNAQDKKGKTPLVRATETGSSNTVNILLQAKANPNIPSLDGHSPIHISSDLNDERSVKLLLDHQANINSPNAQGLTPLHIAAQGGHANLVALFANEGCNLNALNGESQTPLMSAAEYGRMQVVKILLDLQVDTECKNQRNWKAIDLAQVNGHNHCKKIIEDHVKRILPKSSVTTETKPSLFSQESSVGVPAHDKEVSPVSEMSNEVSARDIHTYSDDDTISYEPSVKELNKISLSGALAKSAVPEPLVDRTLDSDIGELGIGIDPVSESPHQPMRPGTLQRISPLQSSADSSEGIVQSADSPIQPAVELEDTSLDELPISNESSNQPPVTLPSEPAVKEIPADSSYSDSSNTSISGNNLYIPMMSCDSQRTTAFDILSPLCDVTMPTSTFQTTAVDPTQLPTQTEKVEEPLKYQLDTRAVQSQSQSVTTHRHSSGGTPNIPQQLARPKLSLPPLLSPADRFPLSTDKVPLSADKVFHPTDKVIQHADKVPPPADKVTPPADILASPADILAPQADKVTPPADILAPQADKVTPPADKVTPQPADVLAPPVPSVTPVDSALEKKLENNVMNPQISDSSSSDFDSDQDIPIDVIGNPTYLTKIYDIIHSDDSNDSDKDSQPVYESIDENQMMDDIALSSTPTAHGSSHRPLQIPEGNISLQSDSPPSVLVPPSGNPTSDGIDRTSTNTVLKSLSIFEALGHESDTSARHSSHLEVLVPPKITQPQPHSAKETADLLPRQPPNETSPGQLNPYLPEPPGDHGEFQLEETMSELSSTDEPPVTARPPLLHALSPVRSKSHGSFLKPTARSTDDILKNLSQSDLNELSTSTPFNPIQFSESRSLLSLTQQISAIQNEKEELEYRLKQSDTNCTKLSNTVNDLKASLTELQREKTQLIETQNETDLKIRKLQFEVQHKSSLKTEENDMLRQLNDKALRLEFQLVKEIEAHTEEEIKRKELELQLHLSQATDTQLTNQILDLDSQLAKEKESTNSLKQEFQTVSNYYESSKREIESLRHEKTNLHSEILKLSTNLNTCNIDIEKLRVEQNRSVEELKTKEAKLGTLQQSLYENNEQSNTTLQQRLEEIRVLEKKSADDKAALEMKLMSLRTEENSLQSDLTRANDRISVLNNDIHGLSEKLLQATTEVDRLKQNNDMSQKVNENVLSVHQTEKEMMEREMTRVTDQVKYQQSKIDYLEQQIVDKTNELKHSQSILTERGNLVTIIQRDMDRNSMLLSNNSDKLKLEETNNAKLVKQLELSNSLLDTSKDEVRQLKTALEQAHNKLAERQALTQELENRYQTESMSVQATISEHKTSIEGERQTLLQDISRLKQKNSLLQEQLLDSQNKCEEYHREILAHKKEYAQLAETQGREMHSNQGLQEHNKFLEEEFHKAAAEKTAQHQTTSQLELEKATLVAELENAKNAYQELNSRIQDYVNTASHSQKAKEEADLQLRNLEAERNELKANLDKQSFYIDSLKDQLTESRRSQTSNDAQFLDLSEKRQTLEQEMVSLREEKNRAQMDATEAKLLWETEVKSRSKLGIKILEFEKDYEESQALIRLEVETKNRAIDSMKDYERQIEFQSGNISRIEEQNKSLLADVKSYKKRIKDFELREHRFPDLKSELSKERSSIENVLQSLNSQLTDTREFSASLKRDNVVMKEQLTSALRERDDVFSELTRAKREMKEDDKSYAELKTESNKLQEEVVRWQKQYREKEKMYLLAKEKEMQNRKTFNHKLQELNSHILEQSQHQDSPGEIQLIKELERKTNQLESELSHYGKNSNSDFLKEDSNYSHKRYDSNFSLEDSSINRNTTSRRRNPKYKLEDSYKVYNKRFSMPHIPSITENLDTHLHPSYVPTRPYTPNQRSTRASKWMDALDTKIANHLNLGDSIHQDTSSFTQQHLSHDPHLSSIFHNYEV